MVTFPLLSSRDGVEIIAALLGHSRPPPPTSSFNVHILDNIFNEIVDSLRLNLPIRREIDVGAAAITSVLNALHDFTDPPPTTLLPPPPPPPSPPSPLHSSHLPSVSNTTPSSLPEPLPPLPQPFAHPPHHQQPQQHHPIQPRLIIPNSQSLPPPPHPSSHQNFPHPPLNYPQFHPHPSQQQQQQQQRQQQHQLPSSSTTPPSTNPPTPSPPPRRPVRKKRYHDAAPSTHCHVCCRPSTAVAMAVCSNIKQGICRKVVCHRCVSDYGWDWQQANAENSSWTCPHCTDSCNKVPRAQCWVYRRTNSRRKENRNKKLKMATMDSVGSRDACGGQGGREDDASAGVG